MTDIELLKRKDPDTIERLYLAYKSSFMAFIGKYQISPSEALDVYQDAFIALIENAEKGKLDQLKADIKTYLFSIGKFMIFAKNKKQKAEDIISLEWEHADEWEEHQETEVQLEKLASALQKLGGQCYHILRMFYYENKKLDEILRLLSYESKDVLKSQKARCIRQLRELISKI